MSGASSIVVPERFAPSITGLVAQTMDPEVANSQVLPTTNDALAFLCPIPTPVVVSQVWISVFIAGITLTAGQNLISLHDALGNILATTPDQSAVWLGGGNFSASLGGSFRLAAPYCWLQLLAVGTTIPTFRGGTSGGVVSNTLGPNPILRSQRVASGAISLGSFNPATSIVPRNSILMGLS